MKRGAAVWTLAGLAAIATAASAQQPAPARAQSPDQAALEVTVLDDNGRPITGLGIDAFAVRIDGRPRRVLSATWVTTAGEAPDTKPLPEGFPQSEKAPEGRVVAIVMDQGNIRPEASQPAAAAAAEFMDNLPPADRVALFTLGRGSMRTDFTRDRLRIKQALAQTVGQLTDLGRMMTVERQLSTAEAVAVDGGDKSALDRITLRECRTPALRGVPGMTVSACREQILIEAEKVVWELNLRGDATLVALAELMRDLARVEERKTVLFVSGGFPGREARDLVNDVVRGAVAARATIYPILIDSDKFSMADKRRQIPSTLIDDREPTSALDLLADATGGNLVRLRGAGSFFERVEGDLSGYYLVSVEFDRLERSNRGHEVRVDLVGRNADVRVNPRISNAVAPAPPPPKTAYEGVLAGLNTASLISDLPVEVSTYAMPGTESGKVQILVHAEIGRDKKEATLMSVAYVIEDITGVTLEARAFDKPLNPAVAGTPSPLAFVSTIDVAPGDYVLKLVAADGQRVGSVKQSVATTLTEVGNFRIGELLADAWAPSRDILAPGIARRIRADSVHAYLEVDGTDTADLSVVYEVAVDKDGPAVARAASPARGTASSRKIFAAVVPVNRLPPGEYVLRASISNRKAAVGSMSRPFEILAPPVPAGVQPVARVWSGDLPPFARRFSRDEALKADMLKPFRDRVAPAAKAQFDAALVALGAGDYPRAEMAFKRAVRPDADSTSAFTYLAVTFASNGNEFEAAAAWQLALVEGSRLPQIYDWLAQSLVRQRRWGDARAILEEAIQKWPSEARFIGPLATVHALAGDSRRAVAMLERYVTARPVDSDALRLGVEWMYQARASGVVVKGRDEDLKLAKAFAEAYSKANGAETALVNRWVAFLEHDR